MRKNVIQVLVSTSHSEFACRNQMILRAVSNTFFNKNKYDFNQNIGKNEPGGMSEVGAILQRQGHLKPFVITGTVKFTKAEWESYVKSLK